MPLQREFGEIDSVFGCGDEVDQLPHLSLESCFVEEIDEVCVVGSMAAGVQRVSVVNGGGLKDFVLLITPHGGTHRKYFLNNQ